MHRVHDLDDGQSALVVERGLPQRLEFLAHRRVLDRLVVGIEHRNEGDVGGALDVVLAAQRVEAGAGPADLPGNQRERDQAARVVGAVDVLRDAHPPEDDRRFGARIGPRHLAQGRGVDAADFGHLFRGVVAHVLLQRREILGVGLDVLAVVEALLDDRVQHRVEHRDVARRLEAQHLGGIARHHLAARVHHEQFGAALRSLLEERGRNRMIFRGSCADDDDDLGIGRGGEGGGDRARADPLHQGGDRGGVAQARAVIDVVAAETGAHQLLEQVGLLVGALGRAEPGERALPIPVADQREPRGGAVERLLPGGLAEMGERVGRVDRDIVLGDPFPADQRLGQPVGVVHVIEAEAALDAEPVVVGRPVLALDRDDAVVLHLEDQLAADPAIGAHALDLAVGGVGVDAVVVDEARRHQRAGRAGLDALAAGDAGRVAHRIVEIEDDLFVVAAPGHADHVVDLDLAAGAHAEIALDAGIELHRHRRMAAVGRRRRAPREAAVADLELVGPLPQPRTRVVRRRAVRLVADQELEDEAPRGLGPLARRMHLHPRRRRADARRGEHPLALDFDHAGAAIAVGAVAGLRQPAQMRDLDALSVRHLPDRLARLGLDLGAIEKEADRIAHCTTPTKGKIISDPRGNASAPA